MFMLFQVGRMKINLERFQMAKLQPLKEKLQSYHYSFDVSINMIYADSYKLVCKCTTSEDSTG